MKVWPAAEHSPLPGHLDSHSPAINMLYRDSSYERSVADPGRNRIWTFHVAIRTYLGDSSELVRVRSQVGGRQRSVLVGQSSEFWLVS